MKRTFDIAFSLLGLLLMAIPMLVIALLVGLSSRGGVFYCQRRVGRFGQDFMLIKFRTMQKGSDSEGLLTVGGRDPRITRSGYFLRKYKLDELPQLLNILKGDMSFVGPRPEVRKYVEFYSKEQLRVLDLRPGLTDFASLEYMDENDVLGRSSEPERTYIEEVMPRKLDLALKYASDRSMMTDIRIIFRTLGKIVR
jgi:lipopolysaccharide/colanic/teichoic acid biosynthesis glycosyltransferase